MNYELHTAMWDDVESGSIWLSTPILTSRTIVRITHATTRQTVYCEVKMVDDDFLRRFTEQTGRQVGDPHHAVFISAWYRKQLGIVIRTGTVDLAVTTEDSAVGKVQACLHHPQVVVRIATMLGLWSVLLGLIGFGLGAVSLWSN